MEKQIWVQGLMVTALLKMEGGEPKPGPKADQEKID
jgi:hypothetical protein